MVRTAFPEARGPIGQMIQALSWEAQGIPAVQHLAPRHTKPGTLDLTAATLMVQAVDKHALICGYATQMKKTVPFRKGHINLAVALEMFFRTLHALHSLWRQKTPLTPADLSQTGLDWSIDKRFFGLVVLNGSHLIDCSHSMTILAH